MSALPKGISNGACECIREYLREGGGSGKTVKQVADLYLEVVSWSVNEQKKPLVELSYRMDWAHRHLQFMNQKKNRIVKTLGDKYILA